ncbi:MAG: twitching motility protein PilT [Deltaproteobacteria bacterium RIFOXYA12_FULL_58_15]|nr:MAG: twitching motility protein PilT [Deltaproteobacteria bacterium RIFOXYA12_FULL_58_15]OGR08356.1 MAG: twitching motility protein PilT [Deltaproteobacteria bacterium RIFOXYB12_FULL_58_9]
MSLLLDTHVFLWWITDSAKLSETVRHALADGSTRVFWSAASTWEVAIKYAIGRLPLPSPPGQYLPQHLELNGLRSLPVLDKHAYRAAALPKHHADPFDRMLVAQAQEEDLCLVSSDSNIARYAVSVLW